MVPPDRRRLWEGLAIAVVGPILGALVVASGPFSSRPGVAFILAVVVATLFGRIAAAAVAIPWSLVLLTRYGHGGFLATGHVEQDISAISAFVVVAVVVVLIVVRREASTDVALAERARFELLVSAGDSLSESLDVDETLQRLGDVLVPRLADWFAVDLVLDGEIRNAIVIHRDPAQVELAKDLQRRFPTDPDAPTGAPSVIRTGVSELTETISPELLEALIDDPELLATMRSLKLRCAMTVPMNARGKTIGAITLVGAENHARYTPSDLQLAEEIADRAALAIDTARLFTAESEARSAALEEARRNELMTEVTAAFGRAGTVDEVIEAILWKGLHAAGAQAGTVGLIEDGHRIVVRGLHGYQPNEQGYWSAFELSDPYPMSDAIRQERPVVLSNWAERNRRYPLLAAEGDPRDHVLVCVPLSLGGTVVGAFSASYPPGARFDDEDLALLRSIGEQFAQAIDRAQARERADRARDRLVAVATASQALARSLAFDPTVQTVMRLGVEQLGEAVALVTFDEGHPSVLDEIGEAIPRGLSLHDLSDPERLIAERLVRVPPSVTGGDEILILPLVIARSLTWALVVRGPRLDFSDEDDILFAGEVARRMARALENARLYRDRDHVARTLQQGLLPPRLPEVPGVEIAAFFQPAERRQGIGGDFYDLFEVAGDRWLAIVGDVCGKGAEAATLTGMVRHTLRALTQVERPSDALAFVNRALLREELDGRFCTIAAVLFAPLRDGGARATVSVAGHPLPQLLTRDGSVTQVGAHGTLLGVTPDIHLADTDIVLSPGDALVAFTDGLLAKHEVSGDEPTSLLQRLTGRHWSSAGAIREEISTFVRDNPVVHDDVAFLVLRATEPVS